MRRFRKIISMGSVWYSSILLLVALFLPSCKTTPPRPYSDYIIHEPSISGTSEYLLSPYVTAGDRIYIIGNQNGTFPDLGWHINGEMGGIWDHPIKLMDGFSASLNGNCLAPATHFINYPEGNVLLYQSDTLDIRRFQFIPDSVESAVVEYTFANRTTRALHFTFDFTGMTDLLPVWLSDSIGLQNGKDLASYNQELGSIVARDSLNDWYVVFGSDKQPIRHSVSTPPCKSDRLGSGVDATLSYDVDVTAGDSVALTFFIAGSSEGRAHAITQFEIAKKQAGPFLQTKIAKYHTIDETASVRLPDTVIEKMFSWLKYNTQWLVRNVPGKGEGLSAGLPDYPWWFGCDNDYALQGVLCTGQFETARKTIELLHQLSDANNGNGRITHEVSTNGVTYNKGNLNETPQFTMLLWDYFQWTGDMELIKKYYPFVKKGLVWLMSTDKDGNLCPDGSGMMEISGLNSEMIDVAAYTCRAFDAAAKMAVLIGDDENAKRYNSNYETLKRTINEKWWVGQQNSFADFRAGRSKAMEIIRAATTRAAELKKPWAVKELNALGTSLSHDRVNETQGYVVYHNWVVNTPMETGLADSSKAVAALTKAEKFMSPFGMYVTGIDRDENADHANIDSMRKKVFSYTGAVMTLPTGVQAVAECRYGRMDEALGYIEKLSNSFSYALPGSMYEVSPDFGMMTQAWNIYGIAVPVVRYFFGIDPDAWNKKIVIRPAMPTGWNDATISKLPVGNNEFSMTVRKRDGGTDYILTQTKSDWMVELILKGDENPQIMVNGVEQNIPVGHPVRLSLTGLKNTVQISK